MVSIFGQYLVSVKAIDLKLVFRGKQRKGLIFKEKQSYSIWPYRIYLFLAK